MPCSDLVYHRPSRGGALIWPAALGESIAAKLHEALEQIARTASTVVVDWGVGPPWRVVIAVLPPRRDAPVIAAVPGTTLPRARGDRVERAATAMVPPGVPDAAWRSGRGVPARPEGRASVSSTALEHVTDSSDAPRAVTAPGTPAVPRTAHPAAAPRVRLRRTPYRAGSLAVPVGSRVRRLRVQHHRYRVPRPSQGQGLTSPAAGSPPPVTSGRPVRPVPRVVVGPSRGAAGLFCPGTDRRQQDDSAPGQTGRHRRRWRRSWPRGRTASGRRRDPEAPSPRPRSPQGHPAERRFRLHSLVRAGVGVRAALPRRTAFPRSPPAGGREDKQVLGRSPSGHAGEHTGRSSSVRRMRSAVPPRWQAPGAAAAASRRRGKASRSISG